MHLSLPLENRARDATSEIPREDLKKSTGVDIIIAKLDEVFLLDKSMRQFSAFKALYSLRIPTNVSVSDFVKEFEHAYFKFKAQDMKLLDTVMALMLLASCSVSDNESRLVMASLVDINYTVMKSALKRIFDKDIEKAPGIATVDIKTEPNSTVETVIARAQPAAHVETMCTMRGHGHMAGRAAAAVPAATGGAAKPANR